MSYQLISVYKVTNAKDSLSLKENKNKVKKNGKLENVTHNNYVINSES